MPRSGRSKELPKAIVCEDLTRATPYSSATKTRKALWGFLFLCTTERVRRTLRVHSEFVVYLDAIHAGFPTHLLQRTVQGEERGRLPSR